MDGEVADCVEHVWRMVTLTLSGGTWTEYACDRCESVLLVGPGEDHPETA